MIFFIFIGSLYEKILSQEIYSANKNAQIGNDTLKTKSPFGAAVRSLLVPGLGQVYNGKKAKAFLAAAGEGFLIYSIYNENKKYNAADNDKERERYRDRRSTFEWWFLFILGISAVDAYVDAYLDRFEENMNISLYGFNDKHISLNLSVKF